jgi:hypothetical protein
MSFNISEFKSRIDRYGGIARKNLFVADIVFNGRNTSIAVPNFTQSDLRFFCKSATIPGLNVVVQDYRPNGFGLPHSVPTALQPDQVNLVFMMDSQHKVLNFFHQWMQKVVNYDISRGMFSEVNGQLPYEMGYRNDYVSTITLALYSNDTNNFYEYTLLNAFPTQISPIDVAWDDNDSYSTMTVNFAYSGMTVTGAVEGSPSTRVARGNGLLEFINSVGATSQLINQGSLPRSVQDAIDSFTSVKNAFNTISSIF